MLREGSPEAGLCARCRHVRPVETDRGNVFWLCERAKDDRAYPRYPRLPVLTCPGFELAGEP